jgi:dipeptide/tripeptide permease
MQSEIEVCPRSRAAWLFVVVSLGVASWLPAKALAPASVLGLVALAMFVRMSMRTHELERPRMLAFSLLLVLQLGFWVAFARIAALALSVAEIGSGPVQELLVIAPLIVLAPVAARVWRLLDAHGLEPSPTGKFSLGFWCLAASCTCLAASVEPSFGVELGAVAACLVALMFAALFLGPACVGAIVELSPVGQRGTAMAGWVLAYVFARALGTWAHVPSLSHAATFDVCLALGFGALATAVLSSFMWHGLQVLASTPAPVPVDAAPHSLGGSVGAGSLVSPVGSPIGSLGGSVGSGSLG